MISLPDFVESVTPVLQTAFAFFLLLWAMKTVLWALKAIGVCEMALTLESKLPLGAFLPFVCDYTLADLACQHRKSSAVERSVRVILPILSVSSVVLALVGLFLSITAGLDLMVAAENAVAAGEKMTAADFRALSQAGLPFMISLVLLLFHRVLWLWCFYRVSTIFAPKSAALYLLLVIFLPFLEGVVLYSIRGNAPNAPAVGGKTPYFE